ncbi:MAG: oxidoreductase [Bacteroidota bacterium]
MPDPVSWSLRHLPRLGGRTAVVTGANSGIGRETARGLAGLGATVILACRSLDRAEEAAMDIRSSVPGADLDVRHLDLADLDSVEAFAGTFGLDGDGQPEPLDLLINNAGVMAPPARRETKQGFEIQYGVNVLGHFALTARLLPHLLRAPEARTVWVSSIAHRDGQIDFDDLNAERAYDPWKAYQQSKLADLMLAFEMQRRLTEYGADMLSTAAHPGISSTELTEDMLGDSRIKQAVWSVVGGLFAMPAWRGALPTLAAAASPKTQPADYIGPDGFREMRGDPARAEIAPQAKDETVARRLWEACAEATGLAMLS